MDIATLKIHFVENMYPRFKSENFREMRSAKDRIHLYGEEYSDKTPETKRKMGYYAVFSFSPFGFERITRKARAELS